MGEGIIESLKEKYSEIEAGYYEFMENLNERIPILKYFVEPLESHGIPSLPFLCLLVLLLISIPLLYFFVLQAPSMETVSLQVTVLSADGKPVSNATVLVYAADVRASGKTNSKGLALIEKAPKSADATLKITASGFEALTEKISTVEKADFSFSLKSEEKAKGFEFVLTVYDEMDYPVEGALVYFSDLEGEESGPFETNALGETVLSFPYEDLLYTVRITKSGYRSKTIMVSPSNLQFSVSLEPYYNDFDDELLGTVTVSVSDSKGDPLDGGTVSLKMAFDGSEIDSQSIVSGKAVFEGLEFGVKLYPVVSADGYSTYNGLEEADFVSAETSFEVVMRRGSKNSVCPPDCAEGVEKTTIELTVLDAEANSSITDAEVKLFLPGNPTEMGSLMSDYDGKAAFDVAKTGTTYYLTACAFGYQCAVIRSIKPGDKKTVALVKNVVGNNADARILVSDEQGAPMTGANVRLFYSDGFCTGLEDQTASLDGYAVFEGVAFGQYTASATYDSLKGTSDVFSVSLGGENTASIILKPASGSIAVSAADALSGEKVDASVTALDKEKGKEISFCQSTFAEGGCVLQVPADAEVFLSAKAKNYNSFSSEAIVVKAQQIRTETLRMISKGTDLYSDFVGIYDASGGRVEELERGTRYSAKFLLNAPGEGSTAGIFILLGREGALDEIPVEITSYSDTGEDQVLAGTTYYPSGDCSSDYASGASEEGYYKWVEYRLPPSYAGTKSVSVNLKVRDDAQKDSKIKVKYRAFAFKGDYWFRDPSDSELGSREKTDSKDQCYATLKSADFTIISGRGKCTNEACISLSFTDGASEQANGFSIPIGKTFTILPKIKVYSRSLEEPFVELVSEDKNIAFASYRFGDIGGTASDTSKIRASFDVQSIPLVLDGSVLSAAKNPSRQSFATLRIVSGESILVETKAFLEATGTGVLMMDVTPKLLKVGQKSKVRVKVTTAKGEAVTDAEVRLVESEGSVFNGQGSFSIVGTGEYGRGEGGFYDFDSVEAYNPGVVKAVAFKANFAKVEKPINAMASDFLHFSPEQLELECDGSAFAALKNDLDVEVPVKLSAKCVKIDGADAYDSSYEIKLKGRESRQLSITPQYEDSCILSAIADLAQATGDSAQMGVVMECSSYAVCGDGICSSSENFSSCPQDCNESEYNESEVMCGIEGNKCCSSKCIDGLECRSGVCVGPTAPCGHRNQVCCRTGLKCGGDLTCGETSDDERGECISKEECGYEGAFCCGAGYNANATANESDSQCDSGLFCNHEYHICLPLGKESTVFVKSVEILNMGMLYAQDEDGDLSFFKQPGYDFNAFKDFYEKSGYDPYQQQNFGDFPDYQTAEGNVNFGFSAGWQAGYSGSQQPGQYPPGMGYGNKQAGQCNYNRFCEAWYGEDVTTCSDCAGTNPSDERYKAPPACAYVLVKLANGQKFKKEATEFLVSGAYQFNQQTGNIVFADEKNATVKFPATGRCDDASKEKFDPCLKHPKEYYMERQISYFITHWLMMLSEGNKKGNIELTANQIKIDKNCEVSTKEITGEIRVYPVLPIGGFGVSFLSECPEDTKINLNRFSGELKTCLNPDKDGVSVGYNDDETVIYRFGEEGTCVEYKFSDGKLSIKGKTSGESKDSSIGSWRLFGLGSEVSAFVDSSSIKIGVGRKVFNVKVNANVKATAQSAVALAIQPMPTPNFVLPIPGCGSNKKNCLFVANNINWPKYDVSVHGTTVKPKEYDFVSIENAKAPISVVVPGGSGEIKTICNGNLPFNDKGDCLDSYCSQKRYEQVKKDLESQLTTMSKSAEEAVPRKNIFFAKPMFQMADAFIYSLYDVGAEYLIDQLTLAACRKGIDTRLDSMLTQLCNNFGRKEYKDSDSFSQAYGKAFYNVAPQTICRYFILTKVRDAVLKCKARQLNQMSSSGWSPGQMPSQDQYSQNYYQNYQGYQSGAYQSGYSPWGSTGSSMATGYDSCEPLEALRQELSGTMKGLFDPNMGENLGTQPIMDLGDFQMHFAAFVCDNCKESTSTGTDGAQSGLHLYVLRCTGHWGGSISCEETTPASITPPKLGPNECLIKGSQANVKQQNINDEQNACLKEETPEEDAATTQDTCKNNACKCTPCESKGTFNLGTCGTGIPTSTATWVAGKCTCSRCTKCTYTEKKQN